MARAQSCWVSGVDDLLVWRLADELRHLIHNLASRPAVRQDVRFVSQLQDSCSGVSRNIAEGYGRRRPREFAHYLLIARGSLAELEDHLREGAARRHWADRELTEARVFCRRTRGAIDGLIRYLRSPEAERNAARTLNWPPGRT